MKNEKQSCSSTTSCSTAKPDLAGKYSEKFITSSKITDGGFIPVISTKLSTRDRLQHCRCRMGKYRDNYKVNPGLYAIGNPDKNSDVFVSANYKLSFNVLRKSLSKLRNRI
jgi:CO dehydrogenase/acetyl-CoA synthase gamma subunit (corrinoid Fe-S protein)